MQYAIKYAYNEFEVKGLVDQYEVEACFNSENSGFALKLLNYPIDNSTETICLAFCWDYLPSFMPLPYLIATLIYQCLKHFILFRIMKRFKYRSGLNDNYV